MKRTVLISMHNQNNRWSEAERYYRGSRHPLHLATLVEPPPHARVARWSDTHGHIRGCLYDARADRILRMAMGPGNGGGSPRNSMTQGAE
jgi:hypothetical protein